MGKLAVIMLLVVLLAGLVSVSPSVDVSAQEPLTSTRITKDWGYEYTALTGDKIEVGDKTTTEFKPVLKLERWGGEAYIEVSLPTTEKISPETTTDKVVWEGQTVDAHFYPLEPTEQYELGGFEFEVILKEKPLTNKIVLDFETQNLKFYYQPTLTLEEIKSGDTMPENVIGSYAVYHLTQDKFWKTEAEGNKYKTGKAFHIYRPRIEDAGDKWVWGELYIDEKTGTITITIPQEFLNTATYPIRHATGATFGYTTKGATSSTFEDYVCGSKFTMGGTGGTAQKMTAWLADLDALDFDGARKCAIYLASDLSAPIANGQTEERTDILPDGPIANATEFDFDFGTDPTVVASTDYVLCIWGIVDATGRGDIARDADVGVDRWWENHVYNGWPALNASDRTGKFSIYCTYTPAVGVVAPTVVTNAATSVEETTATLSGNITATGGENCTDRGFQWDIDTGAPYADNWTESGNFGVGNFTHGVTGLTKGELYYYVAGANNTAGWSWGAEVTFLTKPDEPNTLAATGLSGQVNLTWNKGTGADNTTITAKQGSYPANRADGTVIYDSTGTSYSHTGLGENEQWYYRAWSWCTEGGLEQYSDTYAQANATTSGAPPALPSEILPEGIPAAIGVGHLAWFIPLVLFSVPAFWRRNALLFMLAAACSLMMGFYWYVIFTTNLGLSLGILLVGFGLVCLMFAIGCLFKRRRDSE